MNLIDEHVMEEVSFIYMIDLLKTSLDKAEEKIFDIEKFEIQKEDVRSFQREIRVITKAINVVVELVRLKFKLEGKSEEEGISEDTELAGKLIGINLKMQEISKKISTFEGPTLS